MNNNGKLHLVRLDIGYNQDSFDVFAETDSLQDFDWFSNYISIYLNYDNQVILVRRFIVGVELEHLQRELEALSVGKRNVSQKLIGLDLGLLWNEHWQKIALTESTMQRLDSWDWEGSDLLFLQSNSNGSLSNNTFVYQDEFDNYVLQISSCYPYFFVQSDDSIEYNQWLSSYKILYRKNITPQILKKWILQLKEICLHYRKHNHENYHQGLQD